MQRHEQGVRGVKGFVPNQTASRKALSLLCTLYISAGNNAVYLLEDRELVLITISSTPQKTGTSGRDRELPVVFDLSPGKAVK